MCRCADHQLPYAPHLYCLKSVYKMSSCCWCWCSWCCFWTSLCLLYSNVRPCRIVAICIWLPPWARPYGTGGITRTYARYQVRNSRKISRTTLAHATQDLPVSRVKCKLSAASVPVIILRRTYVTSRLFCRSAERPRACLITYLVNIFFLSPSVRRCPRQIFINNSVLRVALCVLSFAVCWCRCMLCIVYAAYRKCSRGPHISNISTGGFCSAVHSGYLSGTILQLLLCLPISCAL